MNRHMLAKIITIGFAGVISAATLAEPDVQELVRRLDLMQKEMDELRQEIKNSASKEEVHQVAAEVQEMTAAVSVADEWRQSDTTVHMSGYADVGYADTKSDGDNFNVGSFSPIFHFQYRDLVLLEAELEYEIEDDGETETNLEYLTIDWFLNDYMTLLGGKFLSPIGQFRQNLHPSWINKLPSAPPGFGHDGAAPLSELGVQLRGGFPLAGLRTNYAIYISNGPELNAIEEDGEVELEGVEAEGFGSDNDDEKTWGGRFAIFPLTGLELALSAAMGKATVTSLVDHDADTSESLVGEQARDYDVIGADFSWNYHLFNLRGEFIQTEIGAANTGTTASEAATWETWYAQAAYRLGLTKWELVARYADFDSPHNSEDQQQWAFGINYLFASNVVGKIGYELNDGSEDSDADDDRVLLQFSYGF